MATRGIIAPVSGKLHQQKVEELPKYLLLEVPFVENNCIDPRIFRSNNVI
jgi:hypothetical protein